MVERGFFFSLFYQHFLRIASKKLEGTGKVFEVNIPEWKEQVEIAFDANLKLLDVQNIYNQVAQKLEKALEDGQNLDCESIMSILQRLENLLD